MIGSEELASLSANRVRRRPPAPRPVASGRSAALAYAGILGRELGAGPATGRAESRGAASFARWDAGSRHAAVTALQRSAGNRAVGEMLGGLDGAHAAPGPRPASPASIDSEATSRRGVTVIRETHSAPAAPPEGAQRLRDAMGDGRRAAGFTSLPAPTPPELTIDEPQRQGGGWAATVRSTTVGIDTPVSLFPAPGVHDLGPGPTGQQRHLHVTREMSDVIRQGEEEHLLDLEFARDLSYDRAAAVVNAIAAAGPATGDSPAAARRAAAEQVRSALPVQLRWADGEDPVRPWIRAYSRLAHVTIERDKNHWHDMTSGFVLDPREKRRLGVPEADELTRYVGGPQIGQHPPAQVVRARFDELAGG